jgi:hypothetical protein
MPPPAVLTEIYEMEQLHAREAYENLVAWRLKRFLEMGATRAHAEKMAALPCHVVDLHEFEDLRESGCSPALAEKILV